MMKNLELHAKNVDIIANRLGVDLIIDSDGNIQVWGVISGNLMHNIGIQRYDIIKSINNVEIHDIADIKPSMALNTSELTIVVERDDNVAMENGDDDVLPSDENVQISMQLGTPLCERCCICQCNILEDEGFIRYHCLDCRMTDMCVKCYENNGGNNEIIETKTDIKLMHRSKYWRFDHFHHPKHYMIKETAGPVSLRLKVWGESPAYTLNNALLTYEKRPLFGLRTSCIQRQQQSPPPPTPKLYRRPSFRVNDIQEDEYKWTTYGDVRHQSIQLASILSSLFEIDTFVGICGHNRIEWLLADFTCVFSRFVSVGLHTSWPDDDMCYVLNNAEIQVIVCDGDLLEKFITLCTTTCKTVRMIISMDDHFHIQKHDRIRRIFDEEIVLSNEYLLLLSLNELASIHLNVTTAETHSTISLNTPIKPEVLTFINVDLPNDYNDIQREDDDNTQKCIVNDCNNYCVRSNDRYSLSSYRIRVKGPYGYCDSCYNTRNDIPIIMNHRDKVIEYIRTSNINSRKNDPIFSLVYSSGSTGRPKGCVITCKSWNHSVAGSETIRYISPNVVLSYAALGHAMDRMVIWQTLTNGGRIGFVSKSYDLYELLECTKALRPTIFVAMPDLWNQIYSFYNRILYKCIQENANAMESTSNELMQMRVDALQQIRDSFGGRVCIVGTGGAKISDTCLNFLRLCFECPVTNAYGTTEASGICSNGVLHHDVELKLLDVDNDSGGGGYYSTDIPYPRGEICVKTSSHIRGYYRNDEATRATFIDGWCLTGDIGELEPCDYLRIIDRKKNFIELYFQGRSVWLAPQNLQAKYSQSQCIKHIFLHGERTMPYLIAVVVLHEECITNDDDKAVILEHLRLIGLRLSLQPYEIPSSVVIVHDEWTAENGMLTATGKQIRSHILEKYRTLIDNECVLIEESSHNNIVTKDEKTTNDAAHDHEIILIMKTCILNVTRGTIYADINDEWLNMTFSDIVQGDSYIMLRYYHNVLKMIEKSTILYNFKPKYSFIVYQKTSDVISSFINTFIKDYGDDWHIRTQSNDMIVKQLDADTYLSGELESIIHQTMFDMVPLKRQHSYPFNEPPSTATINIPIFRESVSDDCNTILIIGGNNLWHMYVIHELLQIHDNIRIQCFVPTMMMMATRKTTESPMIFIKNVFQKHGWDDDIDKKVYAQYVRSDDLDFGFSSNEFRQLCRSIALIYHLYEKFDVASSYTELYKHNVLPLLTTLRICTSSVPSKPLVYISSTLIFEGHGVRRVSKHHPTTPNELIPYASSDSIGVCARDAQQLLSGGYAQTKWVTETLLQRYARKFHIPLLIYRKGWIYEDDLNDFVELCREMRVYPVAVDDKREFYVDITNVNDFACTLVKPSIDSTPWQDKTHIMITPYIIYHCVQSSVLLQTLFETKKHHYKPLEYDRWCHQLLESSSDTTTKRVSTTAAYSWWYFMIRTKYPHIGCSSVSQSQE